MAIIGNKRTKVSDEIPSSSMADIAFLLLIFFLVTTVFPKDKGLQLVLPPQEETQEVSQKNVIFFQIQENGSIRVKYGESENESVIDNADEVRTIWAREVLDNPNLIAAVHTAPNAPYRHTIAVLDALKLANATRISLDELDQGGED